MIKTAKWAALKHKMQALGIVDDDCIERFILGSGAGGQKINKTQSCVYLKHVPSGIEIKCQKARTRDDNRYFARRRLCEKLSAQQSLTRTDAEQALHKLKRQKKRRSRRAKQKILADKSHRSQLKDLRKKISGQD